ncbi:SdiA-regulated domain-containing protein [Rufibacter sp. DG15C]|uniref:SdiA-regulated domain-containing protein n=1 Tax=Rufibacter sp. DG15C TaxID=1379909 RepID=UPI0009EB4328|nr:SdiA-regulated domain-containing protein [Rufibacter sp. DG15C]
MKTIKGMLLGVVLSTSLFGCDALQADARGNDNGKKGKKGAVEAASPAVAIAQKWDVPEILREVSGIVYLGNNQFACVQDEAGVIFLYNTQTGTIDRQITFAAAGDYEGIALVGNNAYVVRSDGQLFEVTNIHTSQNQVTEFPSVLTSEHNVEGLGYDQKNNRLLLAIKGQEANSATYKGVYAFDLSSKKLSKDPVFKLDLKDPLLFQKKQKSLSKVWQPSEIAIHPVSGDIYLTEASNPQLFILHQDGKIKNRFALSKSEFYKPEGIAFSPSGDLYISNEGKNDAGNILKVTLKDVR